MNERSTRRRQNEKGAQQPNKGQRKTNGTASKRAASKIEKQKQKKKQCKTKDILSKVKTKNE